MAAKFELKKTSNDKFVFNLLASNGQVILTSETYDSRASALQGIESVKKHAPDDARFGRLSARNGAPYFTLKAGNGSNPRNRGNMRCRREVFSKTAAIPQLSG